MLKNTYQGFSKERFLALFVFEENMVLVLLLFAACVLYLLRAILVRPKGFPPGLPWLPLLGSYPLLLVQQRNNVSGAITKLNDKYGPVAGFFIGDIPAVVVSGFDNVKQVFTRPEFQGRPGGFVVETRAFFKKLGIIFSDGSEWLEQKRYMLRNLRDFGYGKSSCLEETIHQSVEDMVSELKLKSSKKLSVTFPEIFLLPVARTLFYFFDGTITEKNKGDDKLKTFVNKAFQFLPTGNPTGAILNIVPWVRFLFPGLSGHTKQNDSNRFFHGFIQEAINEHKSTYEEHNITDFIHFYMKDTMEYKKTKDDTIFNEEQLVVMIMDMLVAGITTPLATLSFLFIHLLNKPNIQRKIQEEIDSVVGVDRFPSIADRLRMPYLEATIREVTRRSLAVPIAVLHRATEETILDGFIIPKDAAVIANLHDLHMERNYWGDPEEFRPERFIGDDGKLLKEDHVLPFGMGKRLCPGETISRHMMFLLVATALQSFSFGIPNNHRAPNPDEYTSGFLNFPEPFAATVISRFDEHQARIM